MKQTVLEIIDKYKKIFIIAAVFAIFISVIIGIVCGKMTAPKIDEKKENEKLVELSKQNEERVKKGDAMTTVKNTPIFKIPPQKK